MKQGDNALGSVCPFGCLPLLSCLIIIRFEAIKAITSLRYLSVSVNLGAFAANIADAVDRLLIFVDIFILINF